MPLLEKHCMKAVVSIIGEAAQESSELQAKDGSHPYLSWDEVIKLVENEYTEVQNHTYSLHKRINGRKSDMQKHAKSYDEYKQVIMNDLCKLQDEMAKKTGYTPLAFAFPFETCTNEYVEMLEEIGLKAAFGCEPRLNYIDTQNTEWLFNLNRFNRPSGPTSEQFFKEILE